jgi:hypothetical protein
VPHAEEMKKAAMRGLVAVGDFPGELGLSES